MERLKLLVVLLFFISVFECLAMTTDEIEDFKNFIKKTSQLDQNLKKGVEPDDDDAEPLSDNAWEESGKFEGDLILNDRQRRLIVENVAEGLSRNGLKDGTKRWPNNEVIYYIQSEHFNRDQLQSIQDGIEDLAQSSCVKFRPYRQGDKDAVVIQGSRKGCFSQVGYQGGYQILNLSIRYPAGRGCFRHGTVVHELLHTLGFYHMQSSPDRDDFIDVRWENIIQNARHNFRKYNSFSVSDFGVGYDYDSVLHYSRRAFSSNGQDTLVPKQNGVTIGQRVGLSDKDTQKLNKMYCDADSDIQAADEGTKLKPGKKKKPKNKPFDGHGIGYHQGKAVAIKLLPTPETYKLPDLPSFHLFDYFSTASQTLSSPVADGLRTGKKINYTPPCDSKNFSSHMNNDYRVNGDKMNLNLAINQKNVQDYKNFINEIDYIVKNKSSNKNKFSLTNNPLGSVKSSFIKNQQIYDFDENNDKLKNIENHASSHPSQNSNNKSAPLRDDYVEIFRTPYFHEKVFETSTSKDKITSNFTPAKLIIESLYESSQNFDRADEIGSKPKELDKSLIILKNKNNIKENELHKYTSEHAKQRNVDGYSYIFKPDIIGEII